MRNLTADFQRDSLLGLDKINNLLMNAGGDGVAIDAHNLIANLKKTQQEQKSFIFQSLCHNKGSTLHINT